MDSFITSNKSVNSKDSNNTPQVDQKFTPLVLAAQELFGRNYISSHEITDLAISHYRTKKGKGITFEYLIENGLARHKKQSQDTLKYHFRKETLFTLANKRPQQYYPTTIKSEIIENLGKNTPVHPTGVGILSLPTTTSSPLSYSSRSPLSQSLEYLTLQPSGFDTAVNQECENLICTHPGENATCSQEGVTSAPIPTPTPQPTTGTLLVIKNILLLL